MIIIVGVLQVHSDDLVVGLATAIAILDVFFILVAVPESLPEKLRLSSSWSAHISWEQADPFSVSIFKFSEQILRLECFQVYSLLCCITQYTLYRTCYSRILLNKFE